MRVDRAPSPVSAVKAIVLSSMLVAALAAAGEPPISLAGPLRLWGATGGAAAPNDFALPGDLRLHVGALALGTSEWVTASQLDAAGTPSAAGAQVSPLFRLGLTLSGPAHPGGLNYLVEYEQDLPTGSLAGTLPAGAGMPGGDGLLTELRKAYLQVAYGSALIVRGGVMTSHFGLGLVTNDGAHGWTPGSASFTDPRGGDRVLRGLVATGPHMPLGLVAAVAVDRVLEDDTLLLARQQTRSGSPAPGDDVASQLVGTVSIGRPDEAWAGVFLARRSQTAADGRTLDATIASVSGLGRRQLASGSVLSGGFEGAFITGTTDFAGTPSQPLQQLRQAALALRGGADLGRYGFAFDGLLASGDSNLDDDQQTAFRANPNYELGMVLFHQVLAAQSARASFTAGDPRLVGVPAPGVERLPTRGAISNTVTVFPRAFVRPMQGVEVYGGPLFAWTVTPPVDPFNTNLAGGSLRNALGGDPGKYYGTELDLGARGRFLVGAVKVQVGVEGGVLVPGGALDRADGTPLPLVVGARTMLGLEL